MGGVAVVHTAHRGPASPQATATAADCWAIFAEASARALEQWENELMAAAATGDCLPPGAAAGGDGGGGAAHDAARGGDGGVAGDSDPTMGVAVGMHVALGACRPPSRRRVDLLLERATAVFRANFPRAAAQVQRRPGALQQCSWSAISRIAARCGAA